MSETKDSNQLISDDAFSDSVSQRRKARVLLICLMIAAILIGVLGGNALLQKNTLSENNNAANGTHSSVEVLSVPKPLDDFQLLDHHGNQFTKKQLKGMWSLLFVGYINCPDICPGTLNMLNIMYRDLTVHPVAGKKIQVLFLSADPKRDTVQQLSTYVTYFNNAFIGLTGTLAETQRLSANLGMLFLYPEGTDRAVYSVNHSTSIIVINPDMSLYAIFAAPHNPRKLAEAIARF